MNKNERSEPVDWRHGTTVTLIGEDFYMTGVTRWTVEACYIHPITDAHIHIETAFTTHIMASHSIIRLEAINAKHRAFEILETRIRLENAYAAEPARKE